MKKFLFVDLDDTLFQTPGKCLKEEDLRPAAYLKSGAACSFTTSRQRAFFELMHREMTLIPATARNRDALSRVDLPFSSYAIIDYGGVVLEPGGTIDAIWLETMRMDMDRAQTGLREVMQIIDEYSESAGMKGRARLIEDCSIPFYIVVKDPEKKAERLEQIEREVVAPWVETAGKDFFIHRNGNNLAVLPKTLNKARAVEYLRKRLEVEHGEIMTLGMGDSESDARFMAACDYAIVPSGSQLAALTVAAL
ncbi:S6PP domain-containing protein [Candidatus Nitrotoga sp. BS]|uniref:HAD family hydrolase n=1 Tax=Candidatus Nitrotoga sp. BS TaxID=2890408 RepID=UPI001EF216A6|nr:HAD family hydrolase [Candidatus Nitrotoga sp. BS]CAH1209734.1 S6PP domain-containing protein [Candidatus Nitrotoga sp. BS]